MPRRFTAAFGADGAWYWWRAVDDLWRWSACLAEVRADDVLHDAQRRSRRIRRIAAMLEHARGASPFYRAHYRYVSPGCTELSAYPSVTRSLLMANFESWVTDPEVRRDDLLRFVADSALVGEPYLGKYAIWTSSGTSGVPGIYVQDADALALYAALIGARFRVGGHGASPGSGASTRMAFIAAIDGHFAGIVSWERQRRLHPAIALNSRAFSILQPLPELVARLNKWKPGFLSSYPTMLALLGRERAAGRLRISPQALWCGGEGLTEAERHAIEADFGCPLVEDYGASEAMNMAFGCPYGRLHVNDDWVVLEPVDEEMNSVPPGEPSYTVLITNLANRVQPIIRYDLGDSITLEQTPCGCGNRRPSVRVGGRRDDMLTLERARGTPGQGRLRLLPLAVETVIEEDAGVYRFQLLQTGPSALTLRLETRNKRERNAAFARVKNALAHFFARHGAAPVEFVLDPLPPQPEAASGKLRHVVVLPAARAPRPAAGPVLQ